MNFQKSDLKNLTNAIASDIINEVNNLKDAIEKQNKRFSQEIKENSIDASEKANQLSLYIDDQIKNVSEESLKKNEKLKQIFTKLAEQFKNHLITYDASKRELIHKTMNLERSLEDERNSTVASLKNIENNLKVQLKESKYELETLLLSKFSVVADKCVKLQEQLNSDIDLVKEAIDSSRAMLIKKVNNVIENYGVFHKQHYNNYQTLITIIEELKLGVKTLNEENNTKLQDICNKILENEAHQYTLGLNEKIIRENSFHEITILLRQTAEDIHQGMYNLKIMIENEERTRVFEKEQHFEGFEQLNAKMNTAKDDFDKFCNDFKVHLVNLKQYFNNLEAQNYCSELFSREEALTTHEEVEKLIENFSKNKNENNEIIQTFAGKFKNIIKEIEEIKKTIEKNMNEIYDEKLHVWVEKIKKQNQELWEESLKHIKTDFKEIGLFSFFF